MLNTSIETRRQGNQGIGLQDWSLIGRAALLPINDPVPVISVSPVVVRADGRIVPLEVRLSAPTIGKNLPIILLSHGLCRLNYLSSLKGLSPMADFLAGQGFVVIQPTHLSSSSLRLDPTTPEAPLYWRSRVEDMRHILDQLNAIEDALPQLSGRLDTARIAAVGHSLGAQTVAMLLGADFTDDDGSQVYLPDTRIKTGVLLAPTGAGGDHLTPAAARFSCLRTAQFGEMAAPALVVVGDDDFSPQITTRGADYHADPYSLGPSPKALVGLVNGEHTLGGITGYDSAETTDENPERVGIVQRMTAAYLHTMLDPDNPTWHVARAASIGLRDIVRVESK